MDHIAVIGFLADVAPSPRGDNSSSSSSSAVGWSALVIALVALLVAVLALIQLLQLRRAQRGPSQQSVGYGHLPVQLFLRIRLPAARAWSRTTVRRSGRPLVTG
ncbi:MAG: hypothetical protein M3Z00_11590 [Actinomycetota bacterium]|nr:hypothetical protein [Actinomycetota bacterium]